MDAKDLRTEAAIGDRSKDGSNKFPDIGSLPCNNNKICQEISSNPLAKFDTPTTRPCAVIGPDRVLPPSTISDAYMKKGHFEPWPSTESTYRHPPEYPQKMTGYPSPIRNISPRQTFQENMQRIMVPPSYNSGNFNEDNNFTIDRNSSLTNSSKLNGSSEPKYCDVPYSLNTVSDNQKNIEMCVPTASNNRNCPPMWHPSGVNIRPVRPYGASELYQYSEYASCAGPRPMPISRPQHALNENTSHLYTETYYHQGNVRFRPYPNVKERYPQTRYDYMNSYPNTFNPPPPFPTHKFDLQKAPHPSYPQVPVKYLENRMNDSLIDSFQRHSQQINYNLPYQNQLIHPAYRPMLSNNLQNKLYSYPPDSSAKALASNKVPYDNNKLYLDYDSSRNKSYTAPENFYVNEMARPHMKSQVIIPNYPTINMQQMPPHPYYRKICHSNKGFEYIPNLRHADPSINTNNQLTRLNTEFSPNTISPSESNTSIDNLQSQSNFEDCGYMSQSSTASIRSIESSVNRIIPGGIHRGFNYPFPHMIRSATSKSQFIADNNPVSKDKKNLDIRQYLQMWNEGDEENAGIAKEIVSQTDYNKHTNKITQQYTKNQEQLYVLGSVNVPSEELEKYEHIQKVSKLPDNIKGCNNIELLKHFEEVIESSNLNNHKASSPRNFQSMKTTLNTGPLLPARPLSPLDVEAKISQSVIHKEVGCNFEIKPCSPEMLNVEIATPVQNILGERIIEKVSNPYQSLTKQNQVLKDNKVSSCKLINTQCNDADNSIKANYSLQDLESNSGVCLASLPRLDNDIELNFPEVNQQFINANKESVIMPKDLQDTIATKNSILNNVTNEESTTPFKEPEKEFAKLSKYRKNKKSENEVKESHLIRSSPPLRTDSVIIKNPDNTRSLDEIEYPSANIKNEEIIKMEATNFNLINILESDVEKINDVNEIIDETPNEVAIDFSINKTHNISITEKNKLEQSVNNTIVNSHKTDEKEFRFGDENDTESSSLLKFDTNKNSTARDVADINQTTNDSLELSELNESCSKNYSESEISINRTDLNIPNICDSVNVDLDTVINDAQRLGQIETQFNVPTHESQNNHTTTDSINKEVKITEDSIIKFNTDHDETSNNISSENLVNSYNELIENEKNIEALAFQTKIVTETAESISENNMECNATQITEIQEEKSCSSITNNFEDPSHITSNEEIGKYGHLYKNKKFNLKKELFSPRIQKLIWCNEDIDFSFSSSRKNTTTNNENNNIPICNIAAFDNQLASIVNIENQVDSPQTNTNLCNVAVYKNDDPNDISDLNLSIEKKENKTVLSTNEDLIESETTFVKDGPVINDNTIKSAIINTDLMLVGDLANDIICSDNTQVICQEENVGVHNSLGVHRTTLKRSLSDSALINILEDTDHESSVWSKKRRKDNSFHKVCDPSLISTNLNATQNNRRNSISSVYNEDNLSFCIVIDDNCIITQETEEGEKIRFAKISDDCLTDIHNTEVGEGEINPSTDIILYPQEDNCEFSEPFVLEISDENSLEQSWVDDIGCVETVVSDDIAEDIIISTPSSPKSENLPEQEDCEIFDNASENYTEKVKYIYGDKMCNDDAELVKTLYRTPQMNVNKTLTNRESHGSDDLDEFNDEISLKYLKSYDENSFNKTIKGLRLSVDRLIDDNRIMEACKEVHPASDDKDSSKFYSVENQNEVSSIRNRETTQNDTVNSYEKSFDRIFLYNHEGEPNSPEVSSTTTEEKNSTILLKITSYKGMITSQLNDTKIDNTNINTRNSCKFTENINYTNDSNYNPLHPRPLITKAAQKYIPPAKEPLDDLKVKLPLPQHSLMKLKQLKNSTTKPKHINSVKKEIPKKLKPKFEDVLKSIDEIQFKMHKERNKKPKKPVPKLVIKKNENGSHYTSASDKDYFNPDLTGRKWQPWVFIEKNYFIDKMATKNKSKAIFNHRKNTYVFADKFQKYKAVSSAKFIISQPKLDNQLKYTIRLKHSY